MSYLIDILNYSASTSANTELHNNEDRVMAAKTINIILFSTNLLFYTK